LIGIFSASFASLSFPTSSAMYFAIIGNHPEISLKELQVLHPTKVEKKSDHLITFDTQKPELLPTLASLVKW
jgi:hypothetical protein